MIMDLSFIWNLACLLLNSTVKLTLNSDVRIFAVNIDGLVISMVCIDLDAGL